MTSSIDVNVSSVAFISIVCAIVQLIKKKQKEKRQSPSTLRTRLSFRDYYKLHKDDYYFRRSIRMDISSFNKILTVIKDVLKTDEDMGKIRGGSISPSICLFCTLRYLSGGSYLDISSLTGISKTSFYTVVWRTIDAIVNSEDALLNNIHFPNTNEECERAAAGFESISTFAITNCVSVLDGYLLSIQTPPAKVVGNVRSYFSGHYQMYGVAVV